MFANRSAKPTKARDFTTLVNEGTEIEGKVTFSGTVRPARGRGSSIHTRSSVAVFGSSVVAKVTSRPSKSIFS